MIIGWISIKFMQKKVKIWGPWLIISSSSILWIPVVVVNQEKKLPWCCCSVVITFVVHFYTTLHYLIPTPPHSSRSQSPQPVQVCFCQARSSKAGEKAWIENVALFSRQLGLLADRGRHFQREEVLLLPSLCSQSDLFCYKCISVSMLHEVCGVQVEKEYSKAEVRNATIR